MKLKSNITFYDSLNGGFYEPTYPEKYDLFYQGHVQEQTPNLKKNKHKYNTHVNDFTPRMTARRVYKRKGNLNEYITLLIS